MRLAFTILALAALGTTPSLAQDYSAQELQRRTVERRAVEAVIWGMPAVNTDLMLQAMLTKTAGKVTHALLRDMQRASLASNSADVLKNPDNSVDLYFGPKPPTGKPVNWVPSDPRRGFELLFRIYGPTKDFFDRNWVLPDVDQVAAQ